MAKHQWVVSRTIKLSREIEAKTAREAEAIAEDLGEIDANAYVTSWKARKYISPTKRR